jgi:Bardet-Biedl syndrome 4 protein
LDPFEWIISYNLGLVHLNTGQYASAFHFLSSSINLKPDFPSSYMYLGVALSRLEDFDNSSSAYEKAIDLDGYLKQPMVLRSLVFSIFSSCSFRNDHVFHLNYAISLYNNGQRDRAVARYASFQKLWNELDPESKAGDPDSADMAIKLGAALGK